MSILSILPVAIPPALGLRREPPRPPALRQPGYEQDFDYDTLLYDAVALHERGEAVLIAPPALNLLPLWQAARIEAGGKSLPFELERLDRALRVRVREVPAGAALTLGFGSATIPLPLADDTAVFRGRNVLMTLSRDNELTWIADWIEFFARVHGIDAVLFFDNGSTVYTTETLEKTIVAVPGIAASVAVHWPALYGPQANQGQGWDSDYGQHGMLEVARWRFLRSAALAVNADIDELLLPQPGFSLAAACAASPHGAVAYRALWTVPEPGKPITRGPVRHRDFIHTEPSPNSRQSLKWTLDPGRDTSRQWNVHELEGVPIDTIFTAKAETRHFRRISTGWKPWRLGVNARPSNAVPDEPLESAFRSLGWR